MKQPDYLGRLAEIVSKSNQLEGVYINNCKMEGTMIKPILAALNTPTTIRTMKEIYFPYTNWNSDEAV